MTARCDMTCEELEEALQEALSHLYDPDYHPPPELCAFLGCEEQDGAPNVRATILRAINSLKPPDDVPPTAYTKQIYNLLYHRFVLRLTQEETADHLNVSRRTVNRLQHRAVNVLASTLWRHQRGTPPSPQGIALAEGPDESGNWESQMQQELASLQRQAPDAVAEVQEVIENTLAFLSHLPAGLGAPVEIVSIQPGLVADVHPVAMHQVLIATIQRLAHKISGGPLSIYARLEDGDAQITLTGPVDETATLQSEAFTEDVPVPPGVVFEAVVDHGRAFVWIRMPSQEQISVLVVDDNRDIARLYRDATLGTRYQIKSLTTGQELLDSVGQHMPDIIVLDVMLPDIDGWRLLMRLHEDSATRSIPVIVCSVVREKELALSLGATHYLAKPVRPREFVEALDEVMAQTAAHGPAPARRS